MTVRQGGYYINVIRTIDDRPYNIIPQYRSQPYNSKTRQRFPQLSIVHCQSYHQVRTASALNCPLSIVHYQLKKQPRIREAADLMILCNIHPPSIGRGCCRCIPISTGNPPRSGSHGRDILAAIAYRQIPSFYIYVQIKI